MVKKGPHKLFYSNILYMNSPSFGSWPGIPASGQDDDMLKRSILHKVANEAAKRGKELTEANMAATKNSETFNKFNQLPSRGGKKSKSKKNKMKSRRNKTKKNKTKKNKTNKKRR